MERERDRADNGWMTTCIEQTHRCRGVIFEMGNDVRCESQGYLKRHLTVSRTYILHERHAGQTQIVAHFTREETSTFLTAVRIWHCRSSLLIYLGRRKMLIGEFFAYTASAP